MWSAATWHMVHSTKAPVGNLQSRNPSYTLKDHTKSSRFDFKDISINFAMMLSQLQPVSGALVAAIAFSMSPLQGTHAHAAEVTEGYSLAPVQDIPKFGLGTWLSDRDKVCD